jgi:hypothetical protein
METSLWIANGLVPGLIAIVTCLIAWRLTPRTFGEIDSPASDCSNAAAQDRSLGLAPLCLGLGWTLAVVAGLIGQRYVKGDESSLLWPDDFWQRNYWGMIAATVIMCTLGPALGTRFGWRRRQDADPSFRWVLAAVIVFASAAVALPGGDGWDDTSPLHRGWMLLLGASGLVSMWSLDRIGNGSPGRPPADRWLPLIVLATLAGPMFVGVTTYSALASSTVSAISATLVCVVFAALGRLKAAVGIVYPAAIFCIAMISAGRFYSYENHPWWTYTGLLWVAPAVAIGDWLFQAKASPIRMGTAAVIAIAMILWTVAWQFTAVAE